MKRQPTLMLLKMTIKLLAGEIPGNSAAQMHAFGLRVQFQKANIVSELPRDSLGSVGHPRAYVTQPAYSDDILLSA